MRRKLKATAAAALVALAAGCSDFLTGGELTTDPNRPTEATNRQLFVGVQTGIWQFHASELTRLAELWAQHAAGNQQQYREYALYEPGCRHAAMDIKGSNKANPTAMILSATMMLRHLGLYYHANQIAASVYRVIAAGKVRTPDMGGSSTTQQFTQAVLDNL